MDWIKICIAYWLTIMRFKMGIGISERKMRILLTAVHSEKMNYELLYHYFSSDVHDGEKIQMVTELLKARRGVVWRYALMSVMGEKDFAYRYMTKDHWLDVLQYSNSTVILSNSGNLKKVMRLYSSAHGASTESPYRYIVNREFIRLITATNYKVSEIIEIYGEVVYRSLLGNGDAHKSLLRRVGRHATSSQYQEFFDMLNNHDKGYIRYYYERAKHAKKKAHKKSWRV